MKKLLQAWDRYWFTPAPLVDLAMFRIIACAGQLFIYTVIWQPLDGTFVKLSGIPHMYQPLAALRFMFMPVGYAVKITELSI